LRPPEAYDGRCARLTIVAPEVDRRTAVLAIAVVGAAVSGSAIGVLTGCDSSGSTGKPSPAPGADGSAKPSKSRADVVDAELRERAVADERTLLAASAAPPGVEPFATLRGVHADHLRVLTGIRPTMPAAPSKAPATAQLAALERVAAAARRLDCVRASATQAPLLGSLAASGNVAAALLAS
jgi:hypothetical protein